MGDVSARGQNRGTFPRLPSLVLILDVGLVAATVTAIASKAVVTWFHIIFVLLAIAALMLPFRQFLVRFLFGMATTVGLVVWAVSSLDTPSEELTELPLLTIVLILVYLVAHGRSTAIDERERAYLQLNDRADLELENLQRQLEQSQRFELVGRTTTGLAHDLRNVFVVVRGCVTELSDDEFAARSECADSLKDIRSSVDRGLGIIDELLWMGREQQHTRSAIDLAKAVREVEPLLRRLTKRRLTVVVDTRDDMGPSHVFVDRITLTQVLMNLVSNADDAIPGDGHIVVTAKIVVRVVPGEEPVPTALLTVSDSGQGFSADALAHAFNSDFTSKGDHHSGLGLTTVWRLVERYGGTVNIESSASSGATITVLLPSCQLEDGNDLDNEFVNHVNQTSSLEAHSKIGEIAV